MKSYKANSYREASGMASKDTENQKYIIPVIELDTCGSAEMTDRVGLVSVTKSSLGTITSWYLVFLLVFLLHSVVHLTYNVL